MRRNNRRNKQSRPKTKQSKSLTIVRGPNIVPARLRTRLSFFKHYLAGNVGTTSTVVRFVPTNCFDVDPTLGSTAMSGFSELAALYELYRTFSSRMTVNFVNLEVQNGLSCGLLATTQDLGTSPAPTAVYSNPMTTTRICGTANGNNKCQISKSISTSRLTGAASTTVSDNFTSLTTGGPGDNWYWFVITSLPSGTFATGAEFQIKLDIVVDFFSPRAPVS
jgi:hypothetical protein